MVRTLVLIEDQIDRAENSSTLELTVEIPSTLYQELSATLETSSSHDCSGSIIIIIKGNALLNLVK